MERLSDKRKLRRGTYSVELADTMNDLGYGLSDLIHPELGPGRREQLRN